MLHGHGDDRYQYQDKNIVADFSSNVWHGVWPEDLEKFIKAKTYKVRHYPEPNAESLQEALADYHQLPAGNILVTNGGTEAFYLIAKAFENTSATIPIPTFSEYEDSCNIHHINISFINRNKLPDHAPETELVYICNPNNPTGEIITLDNIKKMLDKHPDVFFIIDEAFKDFTTQNISIIKLLNQYKNLIIVKSLTKTFSIPGLRLGYILAPPDIIKKLQACKMPWSVNTLAIEAGKYIMADYERFKPDFNTALKTSRKLQNAVNQIEGLTPIASQTTFFLIKLNKGNSADLKTYLLKTFGILIRDASNFSGLDETYVRVSPQTYDQNEYLLKALAAWSYTL